MTTLVCPVEPHELPLKMRRGIDRIVNRIVATDASRGHGRDLFMRIYMAGMHHGVELAHGENRCRPIDLIDVRAIAKPAS